MKTKIVYTLVCSNNNLYFQQARISTYSLKFYTPSSYIVVVVDEPTMNYIKNEKTDFNKYVDEFIVVDIPVNYNAMQRSRFLKTRLRNIVKGDFLYLDTDTVIAGNLEEIDNCEYDIAGVYDSNRPYPIGNSSYVSDWYINSHTKQLEWDSLEGCPNYNGGVLYVKDTPPAYSFYDKWHQLWLECVSKGLNIDMIALCRANKELEFCIKELPGKWNCQIQRNGLSMVGEALVIHCFTGGNLSCYSLCDEQLLRRLYGQKQIDEDIIELVKNARNAFSCETVVVPLADVAIMHTSMFILYKKHHLCFRVLNKFASFILFICKKC